MSHTNYRIVVVSYCGLLGLTPYSLVGGHHLFRGTYCLCHHQQRQGLDLSTCYVPLQDRLILPALTSGVRWNLFCVYSPLTLSECVQVPFFQHYESS
jgi:hypothetical protein